MGELVLPSQASSIVEGCCVPTTTKATTTDEKVELRTQKTWRVSQSFG